MAGDPDLNGPARWSHHTLTKTYPYSPSIASSASSSSSSVFSIDAPSSQSSVSSASVGWSGSAWNNENDAPYPYSRQVQQRRDSVSSNEEIVITTCSRHQEHPVNEKVNSEARQHPRRTQPVNSYGSQNGITPLCPRPPPSLVRQSERKDNFVDSLVDTTTEMIETIWPLSVVSCGRDSITSGKQQNLIGLRTFVQEVLRRSKTSYSTLQVALYYLVLIQSCLPRRDFTMEQSEDSPTCRAMQCGRRMFLAALILASKYLQDRNFSARAWSKISGLRTCEINQNELAFLSAVNWKLHIPEAVFHRWTNVVLRFSPSAQVNPLPRSSSILPQTWKSIIPMLTPELDAIAPHCAEVSEESAHESPASLPDSGTSSQSVPFHEDSSWCSGSNEPTPTISSTIPPCLEPTPRDTKTGEQILPPLPRLGLLPTPQMTPQTGTFCTPAVSASRVCPKVRSSMSCAMSHIQKSCLARSTLDNSDQWKNGLNTSTSFPTPTRRSSLAKSTSSVSSPESMISDVSSRSSRSSSISSVASSNCALPPPSLAVQAARRCANMQLYGLKENSQKTTELEGDNSLSWIEFSKSHPPDWAWNAQNRYETSQTSIASGIHPTNTREAAAALHELTLGHPNRALQREPTPRSQTCRKRSRPNSIDLSVQSCVRDLIAPRSLSDITNCKNSRNEEDRTVLHDTKVADSFLVPKSSENHRPALNTMDVNFIDNRPKSVLSKDGLPRKRTCAGSDRGGREEARMMQRLLNQRSAEMEGMMGSGLWGELV